MKHDIHIKTSEILSYQDKTSVDEHSHYDFCMNTSMAQLSGISLSGVRYMSYIAYSDACYDLCCFVSVWIFSYLCHINSPY